MIDPTEWEDEFKNPNNSLSKSYGLPDYWEELSDRMKRRIKRNLKRNLEFMLAHEDEKLNEQIEQSKEVNKMTNILTITSFPSVAEIVAKEETSPRYIQGSKAAEDNPSVQRVHGIWNSSAQNNQDNRVRQGAIVLRDLESTQKFAFSTARTGQKPYEEAKVNLYFWKRKTAISSETSQILLMTESAFPIGTVQSPHFLAFVSTFGYAVEVDKQATANFSSRALYSPEFIKDKTLFRMANVVGKVEGPGNFVSLLARIAIPINGSYTNGITKTPY